MRTDEPNTPPNDPPSEPIDTEAEIAASMDEGIAEATPEPAGEPPAEAPDGEQEAQGATDGAQEGEPGKDAPPKEAKDTKPADTKDEPHEADTLGLKGKSNERFREMAEEIKTLAPVKAALEAAGIKDIAELPQIIKRGDDGKFLLEQVQAVATPEQFGQTMDYLGLLKSAATGDMAAAEKAFTLVEGEYVALAKVLGKEVAGHDPLAEYPDLQADVESSDLTRKRALEIAAARTAAKVQQGARQVQDQTRTAEQQQQDAIKAGRTSLTTLGNELAAADPHYAAKYPALVEKLKAVTRDFPPSQWKAAAKLAYETIPNPAPAPDPKPAPGPMRSSGHRPAVVQAVYDNPEDALDAGIAAASG